MKFSTYANSRKDLEIIKDAGLGEVILGVKQCNRYATQDQAQYHELYCYAKELSLTVVLEWDILMTQDQIEGIFHVVKELSFDEIRVQDIGAFYLAINELDCPIHLILETGNHNIIAIEKWISLAKNRLKRVVLSIELSSKKIEQYCKSLDVECELLICGRILLFYTPRNLLSAMLPEDDEKRQKTLLTAMGESEESPHKGFPLLENSHGTFMFHIKHFNLIDKLDELSEYLNIARVDLRFDNEQRYLLDLVQSFQSKQTLEFSKNYPVASIRGFYHVNKSDVLFNKLKNQRLARTDEGYLGEVLHNEKGYMMAITLKDGELTVGQSLLFITPEGKQIRASIFELQNLIGSPINQAIKGETVLINSVKGVWNRSAIYLDQ